MKQIAFSFGVDNRTHACESEAEKRLLVGFIREGWTQWAAANDNEQSVVWSHNDYPGTLLYQQIELEKYIDTQFRADFAFFTCSNKTLTVLVVEVDGARWHGTPARIERDKWIDRRVQSGPGYWRIHRYLGNEAMNPRRRDDSVASIHRQLRAMLRAA